MNFTSDQITNFIDSKYFYRLLVKTSFLIEFYDWLCAGSIQASYKVLPIYVCVTGLEVLLNTRHSNQTMYRYRYRFTA